MRSLLGIAVLLASSAQTPALSVAAALSRALDHTQASAVVLDLRTGAVLASSGPQRRSTPGSVIKPLLLAYALDHAIIRADTEVYCRRDLHVNGQALPCTHPRDRTVFTAETALAASCNTWFAELARRFAGPALEAALEATHLPHVPMREAGVAERQLAVLGIHGVAASPLELARAYQQLLRRMPSNGVLARGLRASVSYGMAHPAEVQGVTIFGKTGTASNAGEPWTHGWFAGAIPDRLVLVVYIPHGDGATAARLAQTFFQNVLSQVRAR